MTQDLKAGRELDALIETRVFGRTLDVPRERAMAIVGASYTIATGPTFETEVHGHRVRVPMPDGETIGGHESDDNYNQRYFRYVAQHLLDFPNEIGVRVARDIGSVRRHAPNYSTDIAAAWTLVEMAIGYEIDGDRKPRRPHDVKLWFEGAEGEELFGTATAESLPLAICLAALAALNSEVPSNA